MSNKTFPLLIGACILVLVSKISFVQSDKESRISANNLEFRVSRDTSQQMSRKTESKKKRRKELNQNQNKIIENKESKRTKMNKNIIVKLQKNTTTKKKKEELNDRFKSVDGACIENAVTSMRRWKDAVRKGSYKIRCYFCSILVESSIWEQICVEFLYVEIELDL